MYLVSKRCSLQPVVVVGAMPHPNFVCVALCYCHVYILLFLWNLFTCTCTVAIDCGSLDSPDNGEVRVPGTQFGFAARYSCNVGFVLVGLRTRVCQINGRWSGEAPTCQCKTESQRRQTRVYITFGLICTQVAYYYILFSYHSYPVPKPFQPS